MTTRQMKTVMKGFLTHYNDEGIDVNDSTIHNTVLSASDGLAGISSMTMYKSDLVYVIRRNSHPEKKWPDNWMSLSVSDLAIALC